MVGGAIGDGQFRFGVINDALAAMTAFLRRRIWARRYMLSLEVPPQKFNPPRTRVCHRRAAIEPRTNRGVAVKGRNRSLESKLLPHQGSHWPGSGGRRHCFGAHKT